MLDQMVTVHTCCHVQLFVTPWIVALQASLVITGILQARILEWVACPPPGDLPNPGIEPRSPALWADSLLSEPPGKPENTGVGSLSLLQGSSRPRIGLRSPAVQGDSLPAELPEKPKKLSPRILF